MAFFLLPYIIFWIHVQTYLQYVFCILLWGWAMSSWPSPGSTRLSPPNSPRQTTMALYQAMRATPDHLPKERQKWKDAMGSKWRLRLGGFDAHFGVLKWDEMGVPPNGSVKMGSLIEMHELRVTPHLRKPPYPPRPEIGLVRGKYTFVNGLFSIAPGGLVIKQG